MAKKVVIEASNTDTLYTGSSSLPVEYSFCRAQVIKILKSTECPSTKVQTIMLKTLNSKPNRFISAVVTTPVRAMGIRVSSTSSIRRKKSRRIKKIAKEA